MTHFIIPSVNVFIVSDGKILLSRRTNTGWMDGYLCPPGGHVEEGETPVQAMIREIEEELGAKVDPKDLDFACVAVRNTSPNEYVAYEFAIRDKGYTFTNAESEKCRELVWVEMNELPEDVIDHFRQVIEQGIAEGQAYLEIGYEPKAELT